MIKKDRAEIKVKELLPKAYLERMERLLGDEYEEFFKSYDRKPEKGLRFNTLKARPETIEKLKAEWGLSPVEWCSSGYRYDEEKIRPGKSPYHAAGVYYIQEPSAMISAEKAGIDGGDVVLDLCAAPGGKSTQAAARAKALLSNEIIKDRARILSSNIERLGFSNVVVSSASPGELSDIFPEYFDKIIADVPCSGEGMMRRDITAIEEWSEENVELCVKRQREILDCAVKMLKPSGRIVYSTCTFEPEENEEQVKAFCERHPEMSLAEYGRIYPHRQDGEGHFFAVMEKDSQGYEKRGYTEKDENSDGGAFVSEITERLKKGKAHVLRSGVERGGYIKGKHKGEERYVPSHAEALAGESYSGLLAGINLFREEDAIKYLKGESFQVSSLTEGSYEIKVPSENGFIPVCFDGYPLGFGKYVNGTVKNHYPKGLRYL